MSTLHVKTILGLGDALREGHAVYSQAARRCQGPAQAWFHYLGEIKHLQARQFMAWAARYPDEAAKPLSLDKGVRRAYTYLHTLLRLRPDAGLVKEMGEAETLLLRAFRAALSLTDGDARRELAAFEVKAGKALEARPLLPDPPPPTMGTTGTGAGMAAVPGG